MCFRSKTVSKGRTKKNGQKVLITVHLYNTFMVEIYIYIYIYTYRALYYGKIDTQTSYIYIII